MLINIFLLILLKRLIKQRCFKSTTFQRVIVLQKHHPKLEVDTTIQHASLPVVYYRVSDV
jgi:hypothetical protein